MVYLNDDFEGGQTRFFNESQRHYAEADRDKIIYTYQPSIGDAMVFFGQHTHDGAVLTKGSKYILRSEVMYQLRRNDTTTRTFEPDYVDDGQFGQSYEELQDESDSSDDED